MPGPRRRAHVTVEPTTISQKHVDGDAAHRRMFMSGVLQEDDMSPANGSGRNHPHEVSARSFSSAHLTVCRGGMLGRASPSAAVSTSTERRASAPYSEGVPPGTFSRGPVYCKRCTNEVKEVEVMMTSEKTEGETGAPAKASELPTLEEIAAEPDDEPRAPASVPSPLPGSPRTAPPPAPIPFECSVERLLADCREVLARKGADYSGHGDRLANFTNCARAFGVSPRIALGIYLSKHLSAVNAYIKNDKVESEPIRGRIVDAINYLVLLNYMIERE